MFKFTEMRPHAGVQVHTARLRHIPIYPDDTETDLLKSARAAGLPQALAHMDQHLNSDGFQTRLAGYENAINGAATNVCPKYLLGFWLDQSIAVSRTMPVLSDPYIENVLQHTRGMAKGYGLTSSEAVLDLVSKQDDLRDDLYALMLISSRYPEYRRFCAAQHRAMAMVARYGASMFVQAILPQDVGVPPEQFKMLRVFYGGRILLPQGVDVIALPRTDAPKDDTHDRALTLRTDEVRGAVIPHLELQKAAPHGPSRRVANGSSAMSQRG